jgi:hypothetical protein
MTTAKGIPTTAGTKANTAANRGNKTRRHIHQAWGDTEATNKRTTYKGAPTGNAKNSNE